MDADWWVFNKRAWKLSMQCKCRATKYKTCCSSCHLQPVNNQSTSAEFKEVSAKTSQRISRKVFHCWGCPFGCLNLTITYNWDVVSSKMHVFQLMNVATHFFYQEEECTHAQDTFQAANELQQGVSMGMLTLRRPLSCNSSQSYEL